MNTKIFSRIAIAAGLMLAACTTEDVIDINPAERPEASDIDAVITVDQSTNEVTFTLNNPGVMPVWKIYTAGDKPKISTVNGYHDIVTVAGTYLVEVQMSNRHGVSQGSKVYEFTLNNTLVDFTPYMRRLTGGESKTWQIAADKPGHLGCGEPGSDGLGWWSAQANEKAGTGLYENRFIFADNGQSSAGLYTYDPGTSGTVYVNTGITSLPPYSASNPGDGVDYSAPAQLQETTFELTVEGTDLYLNFPAGTLLGYLPHVDAYNQPKFKVHSMTNDQIDLSISNNDIVWHYILSTGGEPPFTGFKYDSEFNLWKSATVADPTFFYAPGWSQIADPAWSLDGAAYTVTLTDATSDTWQAQMFLATDIVSSSASHYDFSAVFNASENHNNVTVKLVHESDDNVFYFAENIKLKAYEDYVFYMSDMPGLDINGLRLVLDFGGNAAGTVVTISNIVFKDHANDDGTVLPSVDPEPDVEWCDPLSSQNLWYGVTYDPTFFYAPNWAEIEAPAFTDNGSLVYTIALPEATSDQWQAQVRLHTDLATSSDKRYDFRLTINSNTDHNGITVKLTQEDDDNIFYMADRVKVTAYDDCTFKWTGMEGLDIPKLKLVFDFGGNAAGTNVTISNVILQEHIGE